MRLTLVEHKAFFAHLNTRAEKHGDSQESAADLDFRVEVPNVALRDDQKGARLEVTNGETLLAAHCFNDSANPGADLADKGLEENKDHLPHLRFGWAKAPHFNCMEDMVGARLVVHHGLGGVSDLVLTDVKVKAVEGTFKNGGTLQIEFQVQGKPDKATLGELYEKIKSEVLISLTPPQAQEDLLSAGGPPPVAE